jgi:hypothetical protein
MKTLMSKTLSLTILLCICSVFYTDHGEAAEKLRKSPKRGTIAIEHAGDPSLCKKMVWKHEMFGKTMWTLIAPVGAIEADIWSISKKASPQYFGESYARGKFDFDNDGVPDVVYRTQSPFSESYFLIKAQQTPESKNMGLDSGEEAEQWPQDFGIEWLEQESDRVFPSMWANCPLEKEGCGSMGKYSHDYEIKHHKGSQLMYLDLHYIRFTLFRYRDITYLLASPSDYDEWGIDVLFRPRPDKTVDEVCVFRYIR